MKLRAIVNRMLRMSDPAWFIFIRSIQLSAFMLFCSFMLHLNISCTLAHYTRYMTAEALAEAPQGLLLIGILASAILEDQSSKS